MTDYFVFQSDPETSSLSYIGRAQNVQDADEAVQFIVEQIEASLRGSQASGKVILDKKPTDIDYDEDTEWVSIPISHFNRIDSDDLVSAYMA